MEDINLGQLAMGLTIKMDQMLSAFTNFEQRMEQVEEKLKASSKRQAATTKAAAAEMKEAQTKSAEEVSAAHEKSADEALAAWTKMARESAKEDDIMVRRLKENQNKIAADMQAAARETAELAKATAADVVETWVRADEIMVARLKEAQAAMAAELKKRVAEETAAAREVQSAWDRGEALMTARLKEAQGIMAADMNAANKARAAEEAAMAREILAIQEREVAEEKALWNERVRAAGAALKARITEEAEAAREIASAWDRGEAIMRARLKESQALMAAEVKKRVAEEAAAAKAVSDAWARSEALMVSQLKAAQVKMAAESAALAKEREAQARAFASLNMKLEDEMAKATMTAVEYKIFQIRREETARLEAIQTMGLAYAEEESMRVKISEVAAARIAAINSAAVVRRGMFGALAASIEMASQAVIKFVRVAMGITFVYMIVKGLLDVLVGFNSEMEQAGLGLGVVINKYADVTDTQGRVLEGTEKFNASVQIGSALVRQLAMDQLMTAATTEDMVEAAKKLSPMVMAAGGNMKDLRQLTISATNAAKVLGMPIEQVSREINEIITKGHVDARNTFGRMLNLSQNLKDKIATGPAAAMQVLIEATSKFNDAANEYSKSWAGLTSSMSDLFKISGASAGEGVFDLLKGQMQSAIDKMVEFESTADGMVPHIRDSFQGALDGVNDNLTQFAKNWGAAFASFNTGGGLGDFLKWVGEVLRNLTVFILPNTIEVIGKLVGTLFTIANKFVTPFKWVIDKLVDGVKGAFMLTAAVSTRLGSAIAKLQAVINDPSLITNSAKRGYLFALIDKNKFEQDAADLKKFWDASEGRVGKMPNIPGFDAMGHVNKRAINDNLLKNKFTSMDDVRVNSGNTVAAYKEEIAALKELYKQYDLTDHQRRMVADDIAKLERKLAIMTKEKVHHKSPAERERLMEIEAEMNAALRKNNKANTDPYVRLTKEIPILEEYCKKLKEAGAAGHELTRVRGMIAADKAGLDNAWAKSAAAQQATWDKVSVAMRKYWKEQMDLEVEALHKKAADTDESTGDQLKDMEELIARYAWLMAQYPELYVQMQKKIDTLRTKKTKEDKADLKEAEKEFANSFSQVRSLVNKAFEDMQKDAMPASAKLTDIMSSIGQAGSNAMMNTFGKAADEAFGKAMVGGKGLAASLQDAGGAGMAAMGPLILILVAILAVAATFQENLAGVSDRFNDLSNSFANSGFGQFLIQSLRLILNLVAGIVSAVEVALGVVSDLFDKVLGGVFHVVAGVFGAISNMFDWLKGPAKQTVQNIMDKYAELSKTRGDNYQAEADDLQSLIDDTRTSTDERAKAETALFDLKEKLRQQDIARTQSSLDKMLQMIKDSYRKKQLSELEYRRQEIMLNQSKDLSRFKQEGNAMDQNGNMVGFTIDGKVVSAEEYWRQYNSTVANYQSQLDDLFADFGVKFDDMSKGLGEQVIDADVKNKIAALRAAAGDAQTLGDIEKAKKLNDQANAMERDATITDTNRSIDQQEKEAKQQWGENDQRYIDLVKQLEALRKVMIDGANQQYLSEAVSASLEAITTSNPLPVKVVEMPAAFALASGSYFRMMSNIMNNALSISEGAIVINGAGNGKAAAQQAMSSVKELYKSVMGEAGVRNSMVTANGLAGG